MVLPAESALTYTVQAIAATNNSDLSTEVSFAEIKIRAATALGVYVISYNANIVGNPALDPRIFTADLPILQQNFYNAFIDAGYIVGLDTLTGYWSINWAASGPETQVLVYSLRTMFDPTTIITQTTNAIMSYFGSLLPVVYTYTTYNGQTATFYEFTVIAGQDSDRTNHAANLLGFLTTRNIGYTDGNLDVLLMTP
jgi:hypothetical protein